MCSMSPKRLDSSGISDDKSKCVQIKQVDFVAAVLDWVESIHIILGACRDFT